MTEVRIAHTADLDPRTLTAARGLIEDAFEDGVSEQDWQHALGGMHALIREGEELIGHAAVVQRRLLVAGRALRTGYVEGVAVRADRRRRGHGTALLAALERVILGAYEVGALSASADGAQVYSARGWRRWRGPTFALTPLGIARTEEDDGGVWVLQSSAPLNLGGELVCDWRDGDVW